MEREPLTVTGYLENGMGIASWQRADGKLCDVQVPRALSGELVEAEVKKNPKKTPCRYEAIDLSVLKSSTDRIAPRCKHFGCRQMGPCGGCSLQHMSYDAQCRWKEEKVYSLFEPYLTTAKLHPILPAANPWMYRNKMEFSFSQDKAGNRYLGLIKENSRGRVFNIEECFLIDPWAMECVKKVRAWWESSQLLAYSPRSNEGSLRTLTVRVGQTSGDKMVILTVSGRPEYALNKMQIENLVSEINSLKTDHVTVVLRIHQAIKGHPTQIFEMILSQPDYIREFLKVDEVLEGKSLELHISPKAFFQPNTHQACALYGKTLELADLTSDMTVCDLYCGVGAFGMLAAAKVKSVYAIELDDDAAYDAKTNAERLGLSNFTVRCGDVPQVLKKLAEEGVVLRPDVVIVDPPRAGLGQKAIEQIDLLKPSTLMYVSCNPKSQALDVAMLVALGFSVDVIAPVDQFPQTPHVENIIKLTR